MNIPKLFTTQISLSEWFEQIGHRGVAAHRKEDNAKRERLAVLHDILGLPYDKPTQFPATELAVPSVRFKKFLAHHGSELCALRLIPHNPAFPKLRMRGTTVKKVMSWFAKQKINPSKYRADFIPHAKKPTLATIFIVTPRGIVGEIVHGRHSQLTQGFYTTKGKPIQFQFDFKTWYMSKRDARVLIHLKKIVRWLAASPSAQRVLKRELRSSFVHDYLAGYFETTISPDMGLWFIDYNRLLGKTLKTLPHMKSPTRRTGTLQGVLASAGIARGRVGREILVQRMTTPADVPLMMKSKGIITELGGILSHAAIISRELKKPCITGVNNATKKLKKGMIVEINGTTGEIKVL